jgi:RNA ligase (TIGR02306 family)
MKELFLHGKKNFTVLTGETPQGRSIQKVAEWGVFYRRVEVFPHDNADSLEVVRAGNYQFVVRKGTYQTDDMALVIPEKAVLTGRVKEEYQDYLAGSNKDRVKSVKLRGEFFTEE